MKKATLVLFLLASLPFHCSAQTDNTFYAKQFPGSTVGAKVAAAQASCRAAIPCVIVIDPSLAAWAAGTMPTPCAKCSILDYRAPVSMGAQSAPQCDSALNYLCAGLSLYFPQGQQFKGIGIQDTASNPQQGLYFDSSSQYFMQNYVNVPVDQFQSYGPWPDRGFYRKHPNIMGECWSGTNPSSQNWSDYRAWGPAVCITEDQTITGQLDIGSGPLGDATRGLGLAYIKGPATAPTGTCNARGQWVFSQDGQESYCNGSNWIQPFNGTAGGLAIQCNANGCYREDADGTFEEWGQTPAFGGANAGTFTLTYPHPFTTLSNIAPIFSPSTCDSGDPGHCAGNPGGSSNNVYACFIQTPSLTAPTVVYSSSNTVTAGASCYFHVWGN